MRRVLLIAGIPWIAGTIVVQAQEKDTSKAPVPGAATRPAVEDNPYLPSGSGEDGSEARTGAGDNRPETEDTAKEGVSDTVPAPPGTNAAAPDTAGSGETRPGGASGKASPDPAAGAAASEPDALRSRGDTSAASGAPAPDTLPAGASPDTAAAVEGDAGPGSAGTSGEPAGKGGKPRNRIVRETTVNTIDELKGKYRSPKRALFMSLLVPGLGQAYVGHYFRGAAYLAADVALALGWRHYVVVKHDRQVRRYRAFADEHWIQDKYEDSVATVLSTREEGERDLLMTHRDIYCLSVVERVSSTGQRLYAACSDLEPAADYAQYRAAYDDSEDSIAARGQTRARFPDRHTFYELIGKEQEFVSGWADAEDVVFGDSSITGSSEDRSRYVDMRKKATDYSRMQVYFLGGMVVNHIVSALDAALAARFHNRRLYQTEVSWYDRIRLESQVGWDGLQPATRVTAHIPF